MPSVVEHTCNTSTQEAKVGELRVTGQPGQHSKTLSQKKKKNNNNLKTKQKNSKGKDPPEERQAAKRKDISLLVR
jgi:hypothetical protein